MKLSEIQWLPRRTDHRGWHSPSNYFYDERYCIGFAVRYDDGSLAFYEFKHLGRDEGTVPVDKLELAAIVAPLTHTWPEGKPVLYHASQGL